MNSLHGTCPAKLNLALAVTGRRDDGYHMLRSVFLRLALHDDLELSLAADPAGHDELVVHGDTETPVESNLVLRAVALVRQQTGPALPALRLTLTKRIPVAAGLGGGSSDAATAIDLAAEFGGVRLDAGTRRMLALRLGADVPFFAAGGDVALVDGIGERLSPLPRLATPAGVLLVTPPGRLSTGRVFDEFDGGPSVSSGATEHVDVLGAAFRAGLDADGLASAVARHVEPNDLWSAAARLSPTLAAMRAQLGAMLGRPVMLTGSGPTLFSLYPSEAAAVAAASALQAARTALLDAATITATTSNEGADT